MKQKFHSLSFIAFLVILLTPLGTTLHAQADIFHRYRVKHWVRSIEDKQFIEGVFSQPVSSSLEFLSFYSTFESYQFGNGQKLFIKAYSPGAESFILKVEEKTAYSFYSLESKPGQLAKGDNTFGPWQVDRLLRQLNVPASNLGVLLRVRESEGKYVLPVVVYKQAPPEKTSSYKAVFRLGKSISKGEFKVYKGEYKGAAPTDKLAGQRALGSHLGGSSLQITIDNNWLADYSGWVTVVLTLTAKENETKIPFKFFFYKKSDQ